MCEHNATDKPKVSFRLSIAIYVLTVLFAPYVSSGSLSVTSILSLAVSGAAVAWLFSTVGWLAGISTAVPVGVLAYFLSNGSLLSILCSFLYLIFGITFALVYQNKLTRTGAIGISAVFLTIFAIFALILPVYVELGAVSASSLQQYYAEYFEKLAEMLKKSFTITVAGTEVSYISDTNIHQYLNMIIGLIPGVIGFLAILIGYICGWCYQALLHLTHQDPPDIRKWKLMPSPITALFFCVAILFTLLGSHVNYPWLVAIIFVLILCPEFCMAGLSSIFEIRYVDGLPRPRIFRGILLFIGMLNGIGGLIIVTAVLGIFDSLRSGLPKKKKES